MVKLSNGFLGCEMLKFTCRMELRLPSRKKKPSEQVDGGGREAYTTTDY